MDCDGTRSLRETPAQGAAGPVPTTVPDCGDRSRNRPWHVGDRLVRRHLNGDGPPDAASRGPSPTNVEAWSRTIRGPWITSLRGPVPKGPAPGSPAAPRSRNPSPAAGRDQPRSRSAPSRARNDGPPWQNSTTTAHRADHTENRACTTNTTTAPPHSRRRLLPQTTAQQVVPGAMLPEFPPRGWREQPSARGHWTVRLRPRAVRSQEGTVSPNPSRRDVSVRVSRSHASACTSPVAV